MSCFFFFFNDTATTEIYTLSLHDALPISGVLAIQMKANRPATSRARHLEERNANAIEHPCRSGVDRRSEEHTSELQSQSNLVCRLLLEKKKKKDNGITIIAKKSIKNTDHN